MTDQPDTEAYILRKIAERIAQGLSEAAAEGDRAPVPPALTPAAQHLARLAHELKTPLSAIVAAAEIMRDERLGPVGDPRYQGYAADIFDSAHHALGVINAMLGAAPAADDGGETLTFAEIDLNAIAGRLASSVRALTEAAGLTISHCLEPGLPHVIADPVTVRQMLLNLVTNAMRATPAGGHIEISTAYEIAGSVHLSVADTGHGLTPVDIARLLDPGREADFTPGAAGGLGLGFPLILRLARLNGAEVAIDSAPRTGTTVRISFAAGRVVPV